MSGYVGICLELAFFISIGIMTSSWTKNQIIAAMTSYLLLFSLYFSKAASQYFEGSLGGIIQYAGTINHLENFITGIITPSDIVYYLSGIGGCLVVTRISIENRLFK